MTSKQELHIVKWVQRGRMMVNTEALDYDDPMTPYNQAIAQGVKPEDFGLIHPLAERFAHLSRGQLIDQIVTLEKELTRKEQYGVL
jgi:hypothetical protein